MINRSVPGSPSQVGSKPGDPLWGTKQLVASWGRGGSNPPPGAFVFSCCSCEKLLSTSTSLGLWFLWFFAFCACFGLCFGCVICCLH